MELLTEPEQLDEENAWWCDTCENLRLAYKQLTIKKLPKVLIIHLNRFKADG
jgi:ubiquitin carboxyl-terminal hydrolase 4/11/15